MDVLKILRTVCRKKWSNAVREWVLRATDWRTVACLDILDEKNALASGFIGHLSYWAANKKTALLDNEAAYKYKKGNQSGLSLIVAFIFAQTNYSRFSLKNQVKFIYSVFLWYPHFHQS